MSSKKDKLFVPQNGKRGKSCVRKGASCLTLKLFKLFVPQKEKLIFDCLSECSHCLSIKRASCLSLKMGKFLSLKRSSCLFLKMGKLFITPNVQIVCPSERKKIFAYQIGKLAYPSKMVKFVYNGKLFVPQQGHIICPSKRAIASCSSLEMGKLFVPQYWQIVYSPKGANHLSQKVQLAWPLSCSSCLSFKKGKLIVSQH